MASLIPSGSASGTGSMTLAAPVTNSNQTATLPDATGIVMVSGNMPAFSAYLSPAQSISSGAFVKVNLQNENFDTNNNFASSRFTPTVAGYYQINASVNFQASTAITRAFPTIYKNGSEYCRGSDVPSSVFAGVVSTLVYCNGSTDYIELYAYIAAGVPVVSEGSPSTQMSGFLARAA